MCDAGEYEGYLDTGASCLCTAEDLPTLCDLQCRLAQRNRLTLKCAQDPIENHLVVRDRSDTILV